MKRRREKADFDAQTRMLPGLVWPQCSVCGQKVFHSELDQEKRCESCAPQEPNLFNSAGAA